MQKPVFLFLILLPCCCFAQPRQMPGRAPVDIGVELQWYPAGYIPMISSNVFLSYHSGLLFRLGANIANRHDWGKNDNEKGSGFGGSFGYRYYSDPAQHGWMAGIKADLWSMNIDWYNDKGTAQETSGTTNILVFQPTFEAGYLWNPGSYKWSIGATAGFGQEINIKTDGREVGQGGMWSLSFIINYRLTN